MAERMRYKEVFYNRMGRSGLKVSEIGLGTWKFGYPERGDGSRSDERDSLRILDAAMDLGVTFWDTANRYNNMSGNSERIIGTWLRANPDQRRNVIIATKGRGQMDGVTPNHEGLSRLNLVESVKKSLERLQTDSIDLYQWHGPDSETPIEESLRTMDDLISQGLVRYIGVSNHSVSQVQALLDLSDRRFLERIVSVQNRYNVLDGESHPGVVAFCEKNGLGFIPYSPLAQGMLSSRYAEGATPQVGDRLVDEGVLERRRSDRALRIVRALGEVGRQHDRTEAQVALACLLKHPSIPTVIPTARTVQQLRENAGASGLVPSDEEFAKINEAVKQT